MLDYLFIIGCKQKRVPESVQALCERLKIDYHILGDGESAVVLERDWAALGVGPQTHVIVLAHGSVEDNKHCLQLAPEGVMPGIDVVQNLCAMQVGRNPDGSPIWRTGLTCMFACYIGLLVDELVVKPSAVARGAVVVYGRAYGAYEGEDVLEGMEQLIRQMRTQNRNPIHWSVLATHWLTREEVSLMEPGSPALRLSAAATVEQLRTGQDILDAAGDYIAEEDRRASLLPTDKRAAALARAKAVKDTIAPLKQLIAQTNAKNKRVPDDVIDRNFQILVSSGDCQKLSSFVESAAKTERPDPCIVVQGLARSLRFSEQLATYLLEKRFFELEGEQQHPTYDDTPLTAAADAGNLTFLNLLLAKGADPARTTKTGGWTPLLIAAKRGHTEVVRKLCEQQRDLRPDFADRNGRTALYFAVSQSNLEMTRLLVDRGATIGCGGAGSALWEAVNLDIDTDTTTRATTEIVCLLLARRPNVDPQHVPRLPANFVSAMGVVFYPSFGPTRTVVGQNSTVGQRTVIKSGCTIGHDAKIGANVVIEAGSTLGDHVDLGNDSVVCSSARIGNRARVGRSTVFLDYVSIDHGAVIGDNVRINSRASIMCLPNHVPTKVESNAIVDDGIVLRSNPEGNVVKLNWWVTREGIYTHDGGRRGPLVFARNSREYQRIVG